MGTLSLRPALQSLPAWLNELSIPLTADGVQFVWVGQAGFLFKTATTAIGIDLYLSDSLANKYRGSLFPHNRMIDSPCRGSELLALNFVLSTHGHTDHLDPDTLKEIFQSGDKVQPMLVCPRSEILKASERNVPVQRIVGLDHGECYAPHSGIAIQAIASAHEELQIDEWGNNYFLGYIIEVGRLRVYHSGDCIPYKGLSSVLRSHDIDIAFLPVNGRDSYRREHGIAGNFTVEEALLLCAEANIPYLVPHHYGMFDFNTISVQEIEDAIHRAAISSVEVVMVEVGTVMDIRVN
ncbi:MAG: MBL fold metallo-hydrolase [Sphaerochaeta sp.]|jgi:L-ascorbate metabolism protein UlaG (beta-lactamase superfamily)